MGQIYNIILPLKGGDMGCVVFLNTLTSVEYMLRGVDKFFKMPSNYSPSQKTGPLYRKGQ
jgi:hypothetical protein